MTKVPLQQATETGKDTYSPGLPIPGYTGQTSSSVALVTMHKHEEERILRHMDSLRENPEIDQRWLSIARTHFEQSCMALNRAVFKPIRVKLPEDDLVAQPRQTGPAVAPGRQATSDSDLDAD
jgi:hypothetical protein